MENYQDVLMERVQNLTVKLAQKQRQGSLAEELDLCVKLAQFNGYLGQWKAAVQFWQSVMQIAADLSDREEEWRAAAEIAKILCKQGQVEEAEAFLTQNLKGTGLRASLLKAEVIAAIGHSYSSALTGCSVKEFLELERALSVLDEVIEVTSTLTATATIDVWWWDAVAFRAELLLKLGKFEESRWEEAIDVAKTVQTASDHDVLMSMRSSGILAKIYFAMGEHRSAFDFAVTVIDTYKGDANNANYRPRRRIYCEMLLLAGRALRLQLDFGFSMDNLLLAREEAQVIGVEEEFSREIEEAIKETVNSKALSREVSVLRGRKNASPKDLEELADKLGLMGDFEGQAELLERCQAVALTGTTRLRVEKKLARVYFHQLKNWRAVTRLSGSDRRLLVLKGRAYEKLGDLEAAEECLLEACKGGSVDGDDHNNNNTDSKCVNHDAQTALYFHYRHRGKLQEALKLEPEILNRELLIFLSKTAGKSMLIDPKFSYFVTRKPSNSMMKMVGSGMVMRTKTKKTRGLVLKRRRKMTGECKRVNVTRISRRKEDREDEGNESSDGLSDFIVTDEESDESERSERFADDENSNENISNIIKNSNNRTVPKSILIISDDEEENVKTQTVSKPVAPVIPLFDSPIMIRTETLDPFNSIQSKQSTQNTTNSITRNTSKKVFVRLKPGKQIVIPISDDMSVKDLMREAQKRFESMFGEEAKSLGRICGFSLVDGGARLFADDLLGLILSGNSDDTLQAHFDKASSSNNNEILGNSPSKFLSIDEDFRRKLQVLSLKPDSQEEVNFLKTLQDRFKQSIRDSLDLSKLNFDSEKFGEYSGLVNKFAKMSPGLRELNLAESCLVDGDLKHLTRVPNSVDLSNNFLMRPSVSLLKDCEFVDLSYNEIDPTWLKTNAGQFKGLALLGCFENASDSTGFMGLSKLKKLRVSVKVEMQEELIEAICGDDSQLEELQLFAFDWRDDASSSSLVKLSYLENLRVLDLSCNRFAGNESAIDALCRVLKRSCKLKKLVIEETDLSGEGWRKLQTEGIEGNFSLEEVCYNKA